MLYVHIKKEGVVVPTGLHRSIFTTEAVNNIVHNPPTSTVKGPFHGTSIPLIQHPDYVEHGEAMD